MVVHGIKFSHFHQILMVEQEDVFSVVEKLLVNLNHSYLVIAKPSMLKSNFIDIKEKIMQDFEKIK